MSDDEYKKIVFELENGPFPGLAPRGYMVTNSAKKLPLISKISEKAIKDLIKALEAGGYNAAPSDLVSGTQFKPKKKKKLKCDCGAEKTNTLPHSTWCSKLDKK